MLDALRVLFGVRASPATPPTHHPQPHTPRLPDLAEVDRMQGRAFEDLLEQLFVRLGYAVERTEYYDRGADLILYRDGVRTAVQAKRQRGAVGVDAVRAVVAALRTYRCDDAMVVTNGAYTSPARECAGDNDVALWDRSKLAAVLAGIGGGRATGAPAVPDLGSCHACGRSLARSRSTAAPDPVGSAAAFTASSIRVVGGAGGRASRRRSGARVRRRSLSVRRLPRARRFHPHAGGASSR